MAFSSFLLFFGRVVDLYSAKDVFCHGFIAVGVLNLIISFLPDKVCPLYLCSVALLTSEVLLFRSASGRGRSWVSVSTGGVQTCGRDL